MADDDRKPDEKKKSTTPRLVQEPNSDGNVMVDVIMGPYRGSRLTMTAADGQAAINGHWARDPQEDYGDHDPLTDQQRNDALTAATTWAQATWDKAQGTAEPPPPEGGVTRKRDMKPEEAEGYKTRQAEAPKHQRP